jgi:hypothetical protein
MYNADYLIIIKFLLPQESLAAALLCIFTTWSSFKDIRHMNFYSEQIRRSTYSVKVP